jgi:hypothetical protein
VARAPPPANRRKHRNCWAGWLTLFVDIIQLRPPRSSRFSKAGDSGCGYLGVLICYAAERIIPTHLPNLHLRRRKAHSPRPAHVPPAHNPESCSTQIPHTTRAPPGDPKMGVEPFFPSLHTTRHSNGGRREGGGLRALDKVVNSLDRETLVLMLPLMLSCARSLRSRWAGGSTFQASWINLSRK